MFLIEVVTGLIRTGLALALFGLLLPVAFLVVILTSPVRIFSKSAHEKLCDKFTKFAHRLLKIVAG